MINEFIEVAITCPETILGSAMDDKRYRHMIDKNFVVPLTERVVPIIADVYAKPKKVQVP